ncbi:MAG: 2-oxoacid:acceptor oxidoreductase family protein [Candidatus Kariarchaeaceae archaeon]
MKVKIRIGGIGGQGVQFVSKMLASAAFEVGLNVTQLASYTPASRGGLTYSDIVICPDEEEIVYQIVDEPDILVILAKDAYTAFKDTILPHTLVIADKSRTPKGLEYPCPKNVLNLSLSEIAIELGSESVMNMVLFGVLAHVMDFDEELLATIGVDIELQHKGARNRASLNLLHINPEIFANLLWSKSPKKFIQLNLKAFQTGYNLLDDNKKFNWTPPSE